VSSPSAGAAAEGSRMNEALQRVIRKGGRVVSVVVSGDNNASENNNAD